MNNWKHNKSSIRPALSIIDSVDCPLFLGPGRILHVLSTHILKAVSVNIYLQADVFSRANLSAIIDQEVSSPAIDFLLYSRRIALTSNVFTQVRYA